MDPTCSSRGVCVRGECHCSVGWGGTNCETPRATCLDQCSGHGTFLTDTGLCNCDPSWTGHDCSIGKYGGKGLALGRQGSTATCDLSALMGSVLCSQLGSPHVVIFFFFSALSSLMPLLLVSKDFKNHILI